MLKQWFCPKPWQVTDCRIELHPGGEFFTVMEGPGGERSENHGCYLEVVPHQRLVWTGMMTKGFRPVPSNQMGFAFVARVEFMRNGSGILYRARVSHSDEEGRLRHEQMGFHQGWGMAFAQLEGLFKNQNP